MRAPLPRDEAERLRTLREYHILDTQREVAFDDIVELASAICGTPIAAISLVDEHRQWFKSVTGLPIRETNRDVSFCAHAILQPDDLFEVPDTHTDARFADNTLVTGAPSIRFYAGIPLVDPDGVPLGSVCVIDREPRKLSEDQRRALRALGRQAVSLLQLHRMLHRAEAQAEELRQAHRRAQEAAQAKDNFFAGIGHELRTPLNGVVGLTDALLREPLTEVQCDTLATIDRSSRALMRVVNDLLDLHQQENPMEEVQHVPFHPRELAKEVASLYFPEARRKNLTLKVVRVPVYPVTGDAPRTRRLLTQLVDNAVKFTEEGGIEIALSEIEDEGGKRLRCEVHDTGVGLPEEGDAAPFAPFEQGHRRRWGGAGIGLQVAEKLANRIGGRLGGHRREGRGSTVWFEVPVEACASGLEGIEQDEPDTSVLKGKRVLVVEDNPVNVLVARAMLQRLGIRVDSAESGTQALEAADASEFDLVLMDLQMPGIDGIETSRRLRQSGKRFPILAVTASSVESDRHACQEAGMDGYVVKPLTEATLVREMLRTLP